MPVVTIVKYTRYVQTAVGADTAPDHTTAVEVLARRAANLAGAPLSGFVCEGMSPFGGTDPATQAALDRDVLRHAGGPGRAGKYRRHRLPHRPDGHRR